MTEGRVQCAGAKVAKRYRFAECYPDLQFAPDIEAMRVLGH